MDCIANTPEVSSYFDSRVLLHHTKCLAHSLISSGLSTHGLSRIYSVQLIWAITMLYRCFFVTFRLTSIQAVKSRFLPRSKEENVIKLQILEINWYRPYLVCWAIYVATTIVVTHAGCHITDAVASKHIACVLLHIPLRTLTRLWITSKIMQFSL